MPSHARSGNHPSSCGAKRPGGRRRADASTSRHVRLNKVYVHGLDTSLFVSCQRRFRLYQRVIDWTSSNHLKELAVHGSKASDIDLRRANRLVCAEAISNGGCRNQKPSRWKSYLLECGQDWGFCPRTAYQRLAITRAYPNFCLSSHSSNTLAR